MEECSEGEYIVYIMSIVKVETRAYKAHYPHANGEPLLKQSSSYSSIY